MVIDKKTYIIIFAFLTIYLVVIFAFIVPVTKEIFALIKSANKIDEQIASLDVNNKYYLDFENKYKDYKTNFDKIDGVFLGKDDSFEFVEFLENSSKEFNLNSEILPVAEFVKSKSANNWSDITFNVVASGNFLDILSFINKIENGQYLSRIDNLNIKLVTKEGPKKQQIRTSQAAFSIKVFSKNEQ